MMRPSLFKLRGRIAAFALALSATLGQWVAPAVAADVHAWNEPTTPALDFTTRDGKPFNAAALAGKVVVLNFWASWCAPCRAEMPALEKVAAAHSGKDVEVLLVNAGESPAAMERLLARLSLALPVLRHSGDGTNWHTPSLPLTVVLDASSRARWKISGGIGESGEPLRELIRRTLAEVRK